MSATEPGQRRVSVHADEAVVDLTLPAGVPVAALIPSIVDLLGGADSSAAREPRGYVLSRPGLPPFAASTTLADNAICDGTVLTLGRSDVPVAPPRYDDAALAVSATLAAAVPLWRRRHTRLACAAAAVGLTGVGGLTLVRNAFARNNGGGAGVAACACLIAVVFATMAHRAFRDEIAGLTLNVIAAGFAAVAGFLAVPGAPGMSNALLAASAAAVTAVIAARASGCGAVAMTAGACGTALLAAAALAGVLTSAPLHTLGSVSVLVSLGLLGVAARVSVVLAGLSPRLSPDSDDVDTDRLAAKAVRADAWLSVLLAAFSSSAAVGAVVTVVAGAPRLSCLAFGALTGALLLLRSRCNDVRRALASAITGLAVTATTFGVAALDFPQEGPWIAAGSAMLAAMAMCVGFVVPSLSFSPVAHRSRDLLESAVAVTLIPLTCWICGLYGAVRGLVVR